MVRAQPTPAKPPQTVVRAAKMIDVKAGTVVDNPVIVIRGSRIVSVGPNAAAPAGARVIDLGNVTLLPGLIDATRTCFRTTVANSAATTRTCC